MGSSFQDDAKGRAARSVANDAHRMRRRCRFASRGVELQEAEETTHDAQSMAVARGAEKLPSSIRRRINTAISEVKRDCTLRRPVHAIREAMVVKAMQVILEHGTPEQALTFMRAVNSESQMQGRELQKRKKARRQRAEMGDWISVRTPSPLEELAAKELAESLSRADLLLFRMRMDGCSWRFIARVLGISRASLRTRQESLIRAVKEVEVPQRRGGRKAS